MSSQWGKVLANFGFIMAPVIGFILYRGARRSLCCCAEAIRAHKPKTSRPQKCSRLTWRTEAWQKRNQKLFPMTLLNIWTARKLSMPTWKKLWKRTIRPLLQRPLAPFLAPVVCRRLQGERGYPAKVSTKLLAQRETRNLAPL